MLQKLVAMFNRIRASGMLLKAKKCDLFQTSITYLGHKVSESGIAMCENKLERIQHWPPCQNLAELRSFVCFITYYSPFIQNFAELCQPFSKLMHKNEPYVWSSECQRPFDKFKQLVTSAPILGVPREDKGPFTITTDGSLKGLGATLEQEQDVCNVTISFWSKTLNKALQYCICLLYTSDAADE